MQRVHRFAIGALVILGAAFSALSFAALQERPQRAQQKQVPARPDVDRPTQRPSRGDASNQRLEQLWNQMAQLHKQIVALELEGRAGVSPGARSATPGAEPRARSEKERPLTEAKEFGEQKGKESDEQKGKEFEEQKRFGDRGTTTEGNAETGLWKRLADVHKQLVAMEAAERSEQPLQRRAPVAGPNDADRSAPEAQAEVRAKPSNQQAPQGQRRGERSGQSPAEPESMHSRLLMEYATIEQQIIHHDVESAKRQPAGPTRRPTTTTPEEKSDVKP